MRVLPTGVLRLAVGTAGELASVVPGSARNQFGRRRSVSSTRPVRRRRCRVRSGLARRRRPPSATSRTASAVRSASTAARSTRRRSSFLWCRSSTGNSGSVSPSSACRREEFSGSAIPSRFYIGLPGDFYSDAYGEATLYLDAAYTGDVLPGSHIDVYANGFIAANVPLTSADGDILQHLPIKVAMTHLRPGVNVISLEAVLDTEADAVCAPGATAGGPDRFVLFDTSEFFMPGFGRIDRWPNLAALVGTGLPYAESEVPVPIVLGRAGAETYGAALTFLSRVRSARRA